MKKRLINLQPVKDKVREKLIEKYNTTEFINMTDTIDVKVDVKDILEEYMQERNVSEPQVFITAEAYIKMRTLVDKTTSEIGWYGFVNKLPGLDSTYVIEDIIVYPQTVTGATCEQDEDRLFEFEMSLTTEQVRARRFQGHSHVNMGVTPSGVDENFYQDLLSQVRDYYIILVTNKRSDYHIRFYDMENNIMYTDIELKVLLDNGTGVDQWYQEAIDNNLSKPTPIVSNRIGNSNFQGSIFDDENWYKKEDNDKPIWDPYLFEWIDREDYQHIYGIPYSGQFNDMKPASLYSKKGTKHNGNGKHKHR
jgi:hypothetical protein